MGALTDLLPDEQYDSITDIPADELGERYDGLVIDLDRTLTDYHEDSFTDEVRDWYDAVTDRLDAVILSNDASLEDHERAELIEDELGTTVVETDYRKPRPEAFSDAIDQLDADQDTTAVIGDTVFTDILGGNRYGLDTIQLEPRGEGEEPLVRASRAAGDTLQYLARTLHQL